MKYCKKCDTHKPFDMFNLKRRKKDGSPGYQSYCRPCDGKARRESYAKSPEKQKAAVAKRRTSYRAELKEWYTNIKESVPCTDCNKYYPHYVIDFDHVTGDKYRDVSKLVANLHKKETILAEMAKCEPVCANCHRGRTFTRDNKYELDMMTFAL